MMTLTRKKAKNKACIEAMEYGLAGAAAVLAAVKQNIEDAKPDPIGALSESQLAEALARAEANVAYRKADLERQRNKFRRG